jgi:hypothetical protein
MRAKRVDSNQASIVSALRDIPGVSVLIINDEVDFLVGYQKKNFIIELKNGRKPPSKRLRPRQERLLENWKGQYNVCENLDEVLTVIGIK